MILKEKKIYEKMFIVTEYAALIYLNAKVSQLLLKCHFLLFEPNILLHDIMINKSNDLPSKHMKIRPVRLTIADLRQEM